MTYHELDAQLVGRNRNSKRLAHTLVAARANDTTIVVNKTFRGRIVPVAEFTVDNRVTFRVNELQCNVAFLRAMNSVLPPDTYGVGLLVRGRNPYWNRGPGNSGWERHVKSVLIPYTPGDWFDTDSNFLYAAARSNF